MTKAESFEILKEHVLRTNKTAYDAVPAETADRIIKETQEEYSKYSVQTAASFALKRLKKAKVDESATEIKGIIVGARQLGTNGKIVNALFTGRTGIEIQTWRGEVDTGDKKIRLPVNSIAQLRIIQDEYNGRRYWEVANVIGRKTLTEKEMLENIRKITFDIEDARKVLKLGEYNPPKTIAMRCVLAGANAMKEFNKEDKMPIWKKVLTKEREISAEGVQISLRTRNSKSKNMAWIRVNAPGLMAGRTPIDIEDFNELAQEAVERFENPEDQAAYVASSIEDRPVIVIGSVSRFLGDDENGYTMNINALALMEAEFEPDEVLQGQQQLPKKETVATEVIEETPTEKEKPIEDAPELKEETPETTPEAVAPETTPETVAQEAASEIDETTLKEVEKKMLFHASIMRKVKQTAARSEKIKALKTVSMEDLKKTKLIPTYSEAVVQTVYDYLLAELETNE